MSCAAEGELQAPLQLRCQYLYFLVLVRIRQDTSGYVRMRQDTAAYVSIRRTPASAPADGVLMARSASGVSSCTFVLIKSVN